METIKIYIQISTPTMRVWDDVSPVMLEIEPSTVRDVVNNIVGFTGTCVRMTYYKPGMPVGNLNGDYTYPSQL